MTKTTKIQLYILTFLIGLVFASSASAQTAIYRSVGPSVTAVLDNDNSHADTITLSSGTATFSAAVADNVGIGDVVLVDTGGIDQTIDSADTILFISGRTSSTVYTLQTESGAVPTDIAANDTWEVYRAHTSLSNAEAGTANSTLTTYGFSFAGGNRDLVTNNEQWNIACYANGTTADTALTIVDGWATDSDNYIKIYTPTEANEVGTTQRHGGAWSASKYHMQCAPSSLREGCIKISDEHVRVDGLQIHVSSTTTDEQAGIYVTGSGSNARFDISNNIIRGNPSNSYYYHVGIGYYLTSTLTTNVWNNIIYDFLHNFNRAAGIYVGDAEATCNAYNNTVHNSSRGYWNEDGGFAGTFILKNNTFKSTTEGFNGVFDSASTHNVTDNSSQDGAFGATWSTGTTDGTTSNKLVSSGATFQTDGVQVGSIITNTTDTTYTYVTAIDSETQLSINDDIFVSGENYTIYTNMYGSVTFVDETNDDFRLAASDTAAIGKGLDLSGDPSLSFTTDIDGNTRTVPWDAGADQFEPTEFISIVDPDNGTGTDYTSLSAWETGVQADLTAATTKVFSHGGIIGSIADTDSVTGATSGATANVVHATSTQILLESISGTFQSGEQVYVTQNVNYVVISDAGDSAIAVATCRSTSGSADTTATTIDGWTTSATNYIKVWTDPSESYRHQGKWDDAKYRLEVNTGAGSIVNINEDYVKIQGLQLHNTDTNEASADCIDIGAIAGTPEVADLVINTSDSGNGIDIGGSFTGTLNVWNSVIYNPHSQGGGSEGINISSGTANIYNTVVYNFNDGIEEDTSETVYVKNAAVFGNTTDFDGSGINCDYCASDTGSGTNPVTPADWSTVFEDYQNYDFHLSPDDTDLKNAGTNLSSDPNLSFSDDIDGDTRGASWDIGADETGIYFEPTVMQSGGDYATLSAWEAGVQTDLTASTTRVLSHGGITGTISDDASVTGATSSATATVVHATSSQVLLENISGTFQSGEQVQVDASNHVTISDGGEPAIATAKIDGTWSSADTTAVDVDGWITDHDNYIKIYTTSTARHDGKWNNGKYRIDITTDTDNSLNIKEEYVRIEGLQVYVDGTNHSGGYDLGIVLTGINSTGTVYISNNIIRGAANGSGNTEFVGIESYSNNTSLIAKIWNNILYDFTGGATNEHAIWFSDGTAGTGYVYSNTVHNSSNGIVQAGGTVVAKNNVINDCTDGYTGTFDASSDYNISDIAADAPNATFSGGEATVSFVDEANDDLHLADTDTAAKDQGTDLSSDSNLNFSDDIDGGARGATIWDIGADETATKIYRSVGPSNTSVLDDDNSHADTITLASGTATFSAAIADNVGVGDVVLIDTGGTDQTIDSADTILFISARTDSTHYTLQTQSGAVPADIAVNDTWEVYRAYTSLSLAETGTINTTISGLGFSFTGGDRDLVTNNEQWNIACYEDAVDTVGVGDGKIADWTTSSQNYLRVFAPYQTSEVGISQRHRGTEDSGYTVTKDSDWGYCIQTGINYVRVEGFVIKTQYINTVGIEADHDVLDGKSVTDVRIEDNVIVGVGTSAGNGIVLNDDATVRVWNNIIYDFSEGIESPEWNAYADWYLSNNTIVGCDEGMGISASTGNTTLTLRNNLVQGSVTADYNNMSATTSTNISSDTTSPDGASYQNKTVTFVSTVSGDEDFHLSPDDVVAIDVGADLSADSSLAFTDDIDGHLRTDWDIGADEASIEFDPTVMESGGDYSSLASWETGLKTDLTADTTRVFSHGGITGAIADNDTVTGQTSGATATVVHATSSEILLESISGTFQSGEQVYQTLNVNYVTTSNAGNPAIAVAKIDGAWTAADTTRTDVTGWTTGPNNYVKIYTTSSARHAGVWDDTKYRLYVGSGGGNEALDIDMNYTRVDGFQIYAYSAAEYNISISSTVSPQISNMILRGTSGASDVAVVTGSASYLTEYPKIWNNIMYDVGSGVNINSDGGIIANNTVYGGFNDGFDVISNNTTVLKNNIAQSSVADDYTGNWSAQSSNNISSDATAPGSNSKTDKTVAFVDAANDDFHLSVDDPNAVDAGVDLSSGTDLNFTTDIDSATRLAGSWDIGADEASNRIYRSNGTSNTSALDTGNATDTLTISGSTATFATTVPDNVGVGDVLVYDTDASDTITSADAIVFIHARTDSQNYIVKDANGSAPDTTTSANDTWEIYRAYTSLANAEAGTINTALSTYGFSFTGGNLDLVARGEQLNFACYADATDTTGAAVDGWTTGEQNYLKIYTPKEATEVGTSQRHAGVWNDSRYKIETINTRGVSVNEHHVRVEGLQVQMTINDSSDHAAIGMNSSGSGTNPHIEIKSNIIKGDTTAGSGINRGISVGDHDLTPVYILNNIIYDFDTGSDYGIYQNTGTAYAYNNTVYNCAYSIRTGATMTVKNNISHATTRSFYGPFEAASDYNASNDGYSSGGSNDRVNQAFSFMDEAGDNFHLGPTDEGALGRGTNLSSDSNFSFTDDIDGDTRLRWDIGADEAMFTNYKMKGNLQFKGNVRVK